MEEHLEKFLNKGNKILVSLVLSLFCMLLVVQTVHTYEPLRLHFNIVENREGEKIEEDFLIQQATSLDLQQDFITISLDTPYVQSLPLANILINGTKIADFTSLENKIYVLEGDEITIDISPYFLDLSFKVSGSEGLKIPSIITVPAKDKYSFFIGKVK